jgi:hypothetical protein
MVSCAPRGLADGACPFSHEGTALGEDGGVPGRPLWAAGRPVEAGAARGECDEWPATDGGGEAAA